MSDKTTQLPDYWPWLAIGAGILFLSLATAGIITGRVRIRWFKYFSWTVTYYDRAEQPLRFWLAILLYYFAALACLYGGIQALVGGTPPA
jgi:hypothetical protein